MGSRIATIVCALALVAPAAAAADPLPAGTYDAKVTGGTVTIGGMSIPVPQSPSFPVTVGSDPLTTTVTNLTLGPVTVESFTASLDPATGDASVAGSFYAGALGCTLGTAGNPVSFAFDTAHGSAWNAATGAITLGGAIPALVPTCTTPLPDAIATVLGEGGTASVNATLIRRPDATSDSGGDQTQAAGTTPQGSSPASQVTRPSATSRKKARRHHRRHRHSVHSSKR